MQDYAEIAENKAKGFIVLYRSLLDWEYADDDAVFSCFIKILLAVNYKEKKWHGQTIERGSLICSIDSLSHLIHVKRTTLKRCLKILSECGAISIEVKPNHYHKITVSNYSEYQDQVSQKTTNHPTNRATNSPTNNPTTTKQYNNINKETSDSVVCPQGTHNAITQKQEKEEKTASSAAMPSEGKPAESPPLSQGEWRKYCELKGFDEYRAADEWVKVRGHFSEKQTEKVREFLKSA